MIGAGANVLGNNEIGEGSKIGAGSVVLDDVPPPVKLLRLRVRARSQGLVIDPYFVIERDYLVGMFVHLVDFTAGPDENDT